MENIIKKAIEGGYERKNGSFLLPMKLNDEFDVWEYDHNAIVLDPLFWQALGKACGWRMWMPNDVVWKSHSDFDKILICGVYKIDTPLYFSSVFNSINFEKGLNEAVRWLEDLISK